METDHVPYERLIAYAARELDEAELAIVAAHTVACAECNQTVAHFRTIRGLLRADYTVEPPPATVARAQSIFRQNHRVKPQPSLPPWGGLLQFFQAKGRPAVTIGLATLVLAFPLLFSQAVVASAGKAIPGDALYPIKINVEGLQLALSVDKGSKAQLLLVFAQNRLDEIETLSASGRDGYIAETVTAYESAMQQATNLLNELVDEDAERTVALGAEVSAHLSHHIAVLTALLEKAPEPAKPAIASAISVAQISRSTVEGIVEKGKSALKSKRTPTPTRTLTPTPILPKLPTRQTLVPAGQTPIQLTQPSEPPVLPSPPKAQPSATAVPPSPTKVQPSATPVPPSPTKVPPGQTRTPPGQETKIARTPTPTP